MGEFNEQNHTNTAWTCATVRQSDEKLLTTLASSADRRAGEVNVQELAIAAWAFATVKQSDEKLFSVLARAVERSC